MPEEKNESKVEVIVRGETLGDVVERFDVDGIDGEQSTDGRPEEVESAIAFITNVYQALVEANEREDGTTKNKISEYAGVENEYTENALRILEKEGLAHLEKKTWKLDGAEED